MQRFKWCVITLAFMACLYTPMLHGDSFRCGQKLVRTGDSTAKLWRICGEPYHKDRGREAVDVDGIQKQVSVERWHYKRSAGSLEHIIVIYRGNVEKVIVGGR